MPTGKRKAKIAISLDQEVLRLLDRYADGRSRSRFVVEELMRALRKHEWEQLSARLGRDEREAQLSWARRTYTLVDELLTKSELPARPCAH